MIFNFLILQILQFVVKLAIFPDPGARNLPKG